MTTAAPPDPAATASWRQRLKRPTFLAAAPGTDPHSVLQILLDLPDRHRQLLGSDAALERDGYALAGRSQEAAGCLAIGYALAPAPGGMAELGADFHWGAVHVLFALAEIQVDLFQLTLDEERREWLDAWQRYDQARDAAAAGHYARCAAQLDGVFKLEGEHDDLHHWRAHFLGGVLRLGFVGGDLRLIDLGAAERHFATAARHGRAESPGAAAQALTAAAFTALLQGVLGRARGYVDAALMLDGELAEALLLDARVRWLEADEDGAWSSLARAIVLDRGYAVRAASPGERVGTPDGFGHFVGELARDLWNRGVMRVSESLARLDFLREHVGAVEDPRLTRLVAFVESGRSWPLYDLLQAIAERDETVDAVLMQADEVRVVVSELGSGPLVEVEEVHTSLEPYRERVVTKKKTGPLRFSKEEVEWVTKTRTREHKRKVRKQLDVLRAAVFDGAGRVLADCELLAMPAGRFLMGSLADEPGRAEDELRHEVELTRSFYVARTPVTQALWRAVMGNAPSYFLGDNLPVDQVSWIDAVVFCNRLSELEGLDECYDIAADGAVLRSLDTVGYRLPTEAEWEHACRAGTTTRFGFGYGLSTDLANYARKHGATSTSVGTFPPNDWGLYDMHGNVWEWVTDGWAPYTSAAVSDPMINADDDLRTMRGGSWASEAIACRSASRTRFSMWTRRNNAGFRLCMTAPVAAETGAAGEPEAPQEDPELG